MNPRSLFAGSGAMRVAMLGVLLLDALLVENLLFAALVANDDVHSLFFCGLQLTHVFTLLLGTTAVAYYRHARALLPLLFGAYVLAFCADIGGLIAHGILAHAAATPRELRLEIVFIFVLSLLLVVDALGAHFVDRLRTCLANEQQYLDALLAPVATG